MWYRNLSDDIVKKHDIICHPLSWIPTPKVPQLVKILTRWNMHSPDGIKTAFDHWFNPIGTKWDILYPYGGKQKLNFRETSYFLNADISIWGSAIGIISVPAYKSPHEFRLPFSVVEEILIEEGLTDWPTGLFYTMYGVKKPVIFPGTLKTIHGYIVNQGNGYINIIIKAIIPPVFVGISTKQSPLYYNSTTEVYVPDESLNLYKVAENWKLMVKHIHPMSEYQG